MRLRRARYSGSNCISTSKWCTVAAWQAGKARLMESSVARLIFLLPKGKVSSICNLTVNPSTSLFVSPLRAFSVHLLQFLTFQCINLARTSSGSWLHIVLRAPSIGLALELFSVAVADFRSWPPRIPGVKTFACMHRHSFLPFPIFPGGQSHPQSPTWSPATFYSRSSSIPTGACAMNYIFDYGSVPSKYGVFRPVFSVRASTAHGRFPRRAIQRGYLPSFIP